MSKENNNENNNFLKLIATGPINFELTLILTEEEAEMFNVIPNKIHKMSDCASFLTHQGNNFFITSSQSLPKKLNIFDYIRLSSNNRSINTLLFINKAFKKKIFIEYITLNSIRLLQENLFMKDVLKHVTEQNFLFLVENKFIKNLESKIKFSIKINNNIVACFENICDNFIGKNNDNIKEKLLNVNKAINNNNNNNNNDNNNDNIYNTNEFDNNIFKSSNTNNTNNNSISNSNSYITSNENSKLKGPSLSYTNSEKEKKLENESKFNERIKNDNNNNDKTQNEIDKIDNENRPISNININNSSINNNNQSKKQKQNFENLNSNLITDKEKDNKKSSEKNTNSFAYDLNLNLNSNISSNKGLRLDENSGNLKIQSNLSQSPVKDKSEIPPNEADLTADKIINIIKSEGSINKSNNNINKNLQENENERIIENNNDKFSGPNTNISNNNNDYENYNENNDNDNDNDDGFKNLNIYDRFRYDFSGCNYFFIDIDEILSLKNDNFKLADFQELLKKVMEDYPEINIIVNFPNVIDNVKKLDIENLHILSDIIKQSDIHILNKKESIILFNLISKLKNQENYIEEKKNLEILYLREIENNNNNINMNINSNSNINPNTNSNKKIAIGIFFDEFKKVTIIQKQQYKNSIVSKYEYNFNITPGNISSIVQNDYEKIYKNYHDYLLSVFLGGVFSRLFYKKSFNACFTSGNNIMKKVIELIRYNLDPPTDINYYLIRIKKDPIIKTVEEKLLEKKEEKFVLDSINIVGSKMKDYDPLYDNNLSSFFSSKIIRSHLENKGFIDKDGTIVNDPEKRKIAKIETKNILKIYENEKNHLQKIKNHKEKIRLQIRNLLNTNMKTLKSASLKDLNKLSKIYTYSPTGKKNIPLMDLKTTSMKSTKFKNSIYLKQIGKGKKPKSLFDMNIKMNLKPNSNTQSPLKININTNTIDTLTSNRYMTMENVRVSSLEKTEKSINGENSKDRERVRSKSKLSPIRVKSGIGMHTKSRAESRYTSDRMRSISITENNINKDLNNILNSYDYNSNNNINNPIMIDDNVVITMQENDKEKSEIFKEEKKENNKSENSNSINKSKSIIKLRLSSNSKIISGKKENKEIKDDKDNKDYKDNKKIEEKENKEKREKIQKKEKENKNSNNINIKTNSDNEKQLEEKEKEFDRKNPTEKSDEGIIEINKNENKINKKQNIIEEIINENKLINEEENKSNNNIYIKSNNDKIENIETKNNITDNNNKNNEINKNNNFDIDIDKKENLNDNSIIEKKEEKLQKNEKDEKDEKVEREEKKEKDQQEEKDEHEEKSKLNPLNLVLEEEIKNNNENQNENQMEKVIIEKRNHNLNNEENKE
jgi:hypothetical protein